MSKRIIEKFGGQGALASLLQKSQSTVQHWYKKDNIPNKYHEKIIKLAAEKGLDVSMSDFLQEINLDLTKPQIPKATHWGELTIGDKTMPCYVLENGERVFSLKGVVVGLMDTEGGQLAEYIKVKTIKPFLPEELTPTEFDSIPALIKFDTGGESFTKYAVGVPVERFIDLCSAYSAALQESLVNEDFKLSAKQRDVAIRANIFLRGASKVGIIALVDEATGYQYDRAADALQFKLNLFLEKEIRKWEKTFPDQLWTEFGRLTNWKGAAHSRPKYWGKLVMELVYGYLDPDVAKWLKTNAPKPRHGENYHLWLSSQYGLKKLIEHLWMLVGMASACNSMEELRKKMAEKYGRIGIQMTMYLPPSENKPAVDN